jgi:YidC/Oxa1 family membrane protein insertase
MNNTRLFFAFATAFVLYLLLDRWQIEHAPKVIPATQLSPVVAAPGVSSAAELPAQLPAPAAPANATAETPAAATATLPSMQPTVETTAAGLPVYRAQTDLFALEFSPEGANIVAASLKAYTLSLERKNDLIKLLSTTDQADIKAIFLRAQSGLISASSELPNHLTPYTAPSTELVMQEGQTSLEVPFTWTSAGLSVKKIYVFTRGSYAIQVRYELSNQSAQAVSFSSYRQFLQAEPAHIGASFFTRPEAFSFVGTALYSPETKFEKLPIAHYRDTPVKRSITGGWLASLRHHFLVAWIPAATDANEYSTSLLPADSTAPERMLARQVSATQTLAPGQSAQTSATLYIGPKLQSKLDAIAPGLAKSVDYGKVTVVSEPLYGLLNWFHGLVKNWGFAIILVVLLLKALFYKLTEKQMRSAAKMKALAPKQEEIKRRYADDKQKQGQALMELMSKEKVNPLAGCLPILLTIPILMGLYWVLVESVELRQAPFIFWIKDLTAADPFYVLPVMNAVVMFLSSKLTPMTGMDPMQQKMLTYMPLIFGVMMVFFPAGLVLYWTVNGLLQLAQQLYINKQLEKEHKRT